VNEFLDDTFREVLDRADQLGLTITGLILQKLDGEIRALYSLDFFAGQTLNVHRFRWSAGKLPPGNLLEMTAVIGGQHTRQLALFECVQEELPFLAEPD
jgi:hypothetical protein